MTNTSGSSLIAFMAVVVVALFLFILTTSKLCSMARSEATASSEYTNSVNKRLTDLEATVSNLWVGVVSMDNGNRKIFEAVGTQLRERNVDDVVLRQCLKDHIGESKWSNAVTKAISTLSAADATNKPINK
jgi:hypothetical protein